MFHYPLLRKALVKAADRLYELVTRTPGDPLAVNPAASRLTFRGGDGNTYNLEIKVIRKPKEKLPLGR